MWWKDEDSFSGIFVLFCFICVLKIGPYYAVKVGLEVAM
jgi:hypothetical protein